MKLSFWAALSGSARATGVSPSASFNLCPHNRDFQRSPHGPGRRPPKAMKVAQAARLLQSHDSKGVVFWEDVQKLRYRSLAVTAQYGAAVTFNGAVFERTVKRRSAGAG